MKIKAIFSILLLITLSKSAFASRHKASDSLRKESVGPVTDDDSLNLGAEDVPDLFREEDYDTVMGLDEYYHQFLEERRAMKEFKAKEQAKNERDQKARAEDRKKEKPKSVVVDIDQSSQRMQVIVNQRLRYADWKVSTGKPGLGTTPNGSFKPFEMNKNYRSRRFNVILPHGIKFQGGNLIHAASTGGVNYLGQKRSHGCVRLHPLNAKILFELVKVAGLDNTLVVVHN